MSEPIKPRIILSPSQVVGPMYHPNDAAWESYLAFIKTRFGFYQMYKPIKKENKKRG